MDELLRKWLDGPYSRRCGLFTVRTVREPLLPWFVRLWHFLARRGTL